MEAKIAASRLRRIGATEFAEVEGKTYKRRIGTKQWVLADTHADTDVREPDLQLLLVLERQASGERDLWSLFVARQGRPGDLFTVRGGTQGMMYHPEPNVNPFASGSFKQAVVLAGPLALKDVTTIRKATETEFSPMAASQCEVKEDSQHWSIRVADKLAGLGMIKPAKVEQIKNMLEPID